MSYTSGAIANFNTGLGKYDGTVLKGSVVADSNAVVGTSDLSLNTGYLFNPNSFKLPSAVAGTNTGFTITCWFIPNTATSSPTIVDLSCTSPTTGNIVLDVSNVGTTPNLYGIYPGASSILNGGSVSLTGWNFVAYSVCCSGGTQLIQNMFVNGNLTTVAGGTYTPYTVSCTYIGYGAAPYANNLKGRVDDFRYYSRVLSPMEMRVLYSYGTMNPAASNNVIVPYLGTVNAPTLVVTVPNSFANINFAISNTGTFSSIIVKRYLSGLLNGSYSLSAATAPTTITTTTTGMQYLKPSGNSYMWVDTSLSLASIPYYTYTFTPIIQGMYGGPVTLSVPPTLAGVAVSKLTHALVDLSFSGIYSYVSIQKSTAGGSAIMIAPSISGTFFEDTSVNPLTSYTYTVTAYNNANVASSSVSVTTQTAIPPPIAFTTFSVSSVSSSGFLLSWNGGSGTSVSYTFTVNGISTSATAATPDSGFSTAYMFNGLAMPTSSTTPNPFAWTVIVTAANVSGSVVSNAQSVYVPPTIRGSYDRTTGKIVLSLTNGYSGGLWTYSVTGGTATGGNGSQGFTSFNDMALDVNGNLALSGSSWNFVFTQVASSIETNTTSIFVGINNVSILGISNMTTADLSGQAITNGIQYNVYSFLRTDASYSISYNNSAASYIYVLAVGGGGSGASFGGGGGGGGGVVMMPVLLPAGTGTINVSVGSGGAPAASNVGNGSNGNPTRVTFSSVPQQNITAWGGGGAGTNASGSSGSGGAPNCAGGFPNTAGLLVLPNNNNNNFASCSNGNTVSKDMMIGGGGAGTGGVLVYPYMGNGGHGIQCFLPGICDFAPNGNKYGKYYWAGGGGASHPGNFSANSASNNGNNNGGFGGGGGGAVYDSAPAGLGGAKAVTVGGNGLNGNQNGGNGGMGTGGGGGGSWNALSGAGGSGIVIIAFPQSAITNNKQAVAPTAGNDVLSSLSTSAFNSFKGAFGCQLLNYNYFGPVMTLRASSDTNGIYTANFYADVCGNLGTSYLGTGIPLVSWLTSMGANTTYAFVTKWYNQAMDSSFNSSYQYTLGAQPIYDVANGIINFGYTGTAGGAVAPQTNCYLNLIPTALPYADTSYTYITKHLNLTPGNWTSFFAGGTAGGSTACTLEAYVRNSAGYGIEWYGGGMIGWSTQVGNIAPNTVLTTKYASGGGANNMSLYVNGAGTFITASGRNQQPSPNAIGSNLSWNSPLNGQLYYFYYWNTSIADADRTIVESTYYAVPKKVPGTQFVPLQYNSPTNLSLSWSANSNVSYYNVYVNNFYSSTISNASTIGNANLQLSINDSSYQLFLVGYNSNNAIVTYVTGVYGNGTAKFVFGTGAGITSTTNGNYKIYAYTNTGAYTNTISFSGLGGIMYVFCCGGGGAGAYGEGGAGGAGGFVQQVIVLNSADTISLSVGAGGTATSGAGNNGGNTTVTFTNATTKNITAYGGGGGGGYGQQGQNGGSGGGGYSSGGASIAGQGNIGGTGAGNYSTALGTYGGGGGADTSGGSFYSTVANYTNGAGMGGNGKKIDLAAFVGSPYGNYYWCGGGGGGVFQNNQYAICGNGGLGGGGGGSMMNGNTVGGKDGLGDTNGINPGQNGALTYGKGGNGGANTGGGGGNSGGVGGSGIVLIAVPISQI